jgi:acyl-coenzyme A thioesterase PaaI-like protein
MTTQQPQGTNLRIWNALRNLPLGTWVFSRAVCLKAPYFRSVHPAVEELRPGHCVATARNRRGTRNHLGTFHAIASCNMAELAGGLMTDATVPPSHRWIPVGMTVEYKAQLKTAVTAIAHLDSLPEFGGEPIELMVPVDIRDTDGNVCVAARITMRISPRRI